MHLSYFVLVSAVFLSGCRKKKIDSEMSVYYLNEDRTGLVKAPYETRKTAKGKKMTDKEICGMAEDILETLRNHRIKSKMFLRFRMKYLYKNVNCGEYIRYRLQ